MRDRSLITIAALTALHRPNELRIHLGRGLDNGLSRTEIGELIMHMAIYGGFPVAVEATRIAREVFDDGMPRRAVSGASFYDRPGPLAQLVEHRTFNPGSRVRVPDGPPNGMVGNAPSWSLGFSTPPRSLRGANTSSM